MAKKTSSPARKKLTEKSKETLFSVFQEIFEEEYLSSSKTVWAKIRVRGGKKEKTDHALDETIAEQTKNAEMKNTENVLTQEQEEEEVPKMITLLKTAGKVPAENATMDTEELYETSNYKDMDKPHENIPDIKEQSTEQCPAFSAEDIEETHVCSEEKRCFLVDSENVANRWIPLLREKKLGDRIFLFYTAKSPTLPYELVKELIQNPDSAQLGWISCFMGLNALDFQLVSELGHMIGTNGTDAEITYYILSNDHGYDAVCQYWCRQGVTVKRISAPKELQLSDESIPIKEPSYDITIEGLEDAPISAAKEKMPVPVKTVQEQLEDILLAVGVRDAKVASRDILALSEYIPMDSEQTRTAFLKAYLGPMYGASVSKKMAEKEGLLNRFYPNGMLSAERKKQYMEKVLRIFGFSSKDIKVIAPSAPSLKKNSRLIDTHKQYLIKKYGSKEGQKKYEILEAHLKVLELI